MLSSSMSGNGFSKIMFWLDGLIPSYRHFVIDLVSLICVTFSVNGFKALRNTKEDVVSWSLSGSSVFEQVFILIVLNCILRGADWDVRNRWPITFPLVSILLLEVVQLCLQLIVRQLFHEDDAVLWWLSVGTRVMENFVVATSVLLCGLFPVVKLPNPKGPHSVGIIEQMQLPVNWAVAADKLKATQPQRIETETSKVIGDPSYLNEQESVNIRLFYPTNTPQASFKKGCQYIPTSFSSKFCDHVMKSAAPYPLNKFGFLLYNWKLVQIPAIPNAPLLMKKEKEGTNETFPLVVYSHGLFGSPHLYTKQALDLASNGYIVMMIHHKDGSSPYVPLEGMEQKRYDEYKHWLDGFVREHFQKHKDYTEVVRFRRRQTIFRATEVLSATDALLEAQSQKSNTSTSSDAHQALSRLFEYTDKIDKRRIIFMGHSFGGATATTATATALFHASGANDESPVNTWYPCALIAHEPANDWSSDFARYTLYNNGILEQGRTICKDANASAGEENDKTSADDKYSGGTGGYDCGDEKALEEILTKKGSAVKTIHNIPTLVLFSNEWASKGWGGSSLMKQMATAHDNHTDEYPSRFIVKVIPYSSHQEFSDTCSFIPLWLGRLTKQIPPRAESGGKTPIDQLSDIWEQTYNHFLDSIVKTEKKV